MQRFVRDVVALTGEIISEHFQPRTLEKMAGVDVIDDTKTKMNFDDAVELLRHDVLRCYRIDIETDSTIAIDEQKEKQAVSELFGSLGQFSQQFGAVAQVMPELKPLLPEFFLFAARRFRAGKNLEGAIETAQEQAAQQPPPQPQPDPKLIEVQQKAQIEQAKLQFEQAKLQAEQQKEGAEQQLEQAKLQLEQVKLDHEKWVVEREAQIKREELHVKATGKVPNKKPEVISISFKTDPLTGERTGTAIKMPDEIEEQTEVIEQ